MRVILLLKVQDFNVDMPVVCMPNRGLRRRSHHNSREPAVYSIILLRPQLNKNEKEKEKKKEKKERMIGEERDDISLLFEQAFLHDGCYTN